MEAPSQDVLPFVDEIAVLVAASPEVTWKGLVATLPRLFDGGRARGLARTLGCADLHASGEFPTAGSTLVGAHVRAADAPRTLALEGRHRFSRYRLEFVLEHADAEGTLLRARTWAAFPGIRGRAYRALVIGSRAHVVVTRRMLRGVKRRAESFGREASSRRDKQQAEG